MTQNDLARFQNTLGKKQAELRTSALVSIAMLSNARVLAEEAFCKTARELAIASLNRQSTMRNRVESALLRIHDGSFGACVQCGNAIGRRRLEAVPWTPFCIPCQEAADLGEESVLESVEPALFDAA